jgi:hypothetical protein
MKTSAVQREPGGATHRLALKGGVRKAAAVGLGVTMVGGSIAFSTTSAQADPSRPPEPQVTLCHATGSFSNPYSETTVDQSSIIDDGRVLKSGHGSHTGPLFDPEGGKQQPSWGDIIPAFGTGEDAFGGVNASAGASILANHCSTPKPVEYTICHWNGEGFTKLSLSAADILDEHASGVSISERQSTNHPDDIIPSIPGLPGGRNIDTPRGASILKNNCSSGPYDRAGAELVPICTVNPSSTGSPYIRETNVRTDELVSPSGAALGKALVAGNGVYPVSGFGNIVPTIPASAYLSTEYAGTNWTLTQFGGKAIWDANCNVIGIPSPGPTVIVPGTNTTTTVTVPGPTVTVTASPSVTPSVSASTVPPVGVAPSATPVVTPSKVPPVAVAPVSAAVPTAVNAGDGSSVNRPMSPVGIVLLALAGVGVLYAALKLSARRRPTSSQQ